MPTYEYECQSCGHGFELFQSMKDSPKRTCPKCGKRSLRRLIGAGAGVIFKGSGFYQTDYRSSDYKQKAKAEQPGAGASKAGDNGKADGKSAGKPDNSAAKNKPCGPGCACAGE